MDNHSHEQQTIHRNLGWMITIILACDNKCASSQIAYGLVMRHQDQQQRYTKQQELIKQHYGLGFMYFFIIALARHTFAADALIRPLSSLMSTRILSLIRSYCWMPTERTWLCEIVSQMAVVMAFLCTLVPSHKNDWIFCIIELHQSVNAI